MLCNLKTTKKLQITVCISCFSSPEWKAQVSYHILIEICMLPVINFLHYKLLQNYGIQFWGEEDSNLDFQSERHVIFQENLLNYLTINACLYSFLFFINFEK